MLPAIMLATARDANAADPQQVNFTLSGCRNNGGITLPNGSGDFICPDSAYTTGNLGKGWNELDLVPFRLTATAGNSAPATQTYTVAVAVNYSKSGVPGYDFLSVPVLNTALSSPSCTQPTVGAPTVTGTTTQTLSELVTITQNANTTCVYDYYARLALGSHLYSGSSLHANLLNAALGTSGIGSKDVSIPVNEIAPQQLSKTMGVVKNSDFTWVLTKQASPAVLNFADTCDPAAPLTASVNITLSWTKSAANASGYTITTTVTATNPASRVITVQATDKIYAGTTLLDTTVGSAVDLPANSSTTVLTHVFSITPAELTALGVDPNAPNFNDVATATYTDKVTGIPVPGTTSATASVANGDIGDGSVSGNSIDITDSESITGAGLTFSVATPSVGSFSGYTAGDSTTGPVVWNLNGQTSSGSVTFNKTVTATAATATSGTLSDSATGTFGASTTNASASTTISANPLVSLTINKTRSPVTSEDQTFNFVVTDAANTVVASPSITVPGGTGSATATSTTVTGLAPGTYTVNEPASGPYAAKSGSATITLPSCSGSVSFNNVAAPAGARVQKITQGGPSGTIWQFTLSGPDVGASGTETVNATAGAGYVSFLSALDTDGATYTITETPQTGYDLTSVTGDFNGTAARVTTDKTARTCTFVLDQPADSGGTLSCTFTNTARGHIIIKKVTHPSGSTQSFEFDPSYGSNFFLTDQQTDDSGLLAPDTYSVAEVNIPSDWDLTSATCSDGSPVTAISLQAGESITCTFTNTQRGHAKVIKTVNGAAPSGTQAFTFQLRQGASTVAAGTILESGTANATDGGVINFSTALIPGDTYQLCEIVMPGWMNNFATSFTVFSPNGDNSVVCTNFTVTAGQLRIFNIDNTPPPGGLARTIGFWKNWASCSSSNGKQRYVLDQTLASFPNGGVWIGKIFVNTCLEAVRLLDKSRVDTGVKKASDPLFNLAAQLLAAKLNVQAGAGTCAAATSAISAAQALLEKYNFNGMTHGTLTAADKTLANQLATTLDRYNNNLLC